jgi:cyclopropane fatty-acyl-phospholipid synthase-like methyltransferase
MYQLFGKMAKSIADSSLVVGRTTLQKFSEPYMIRDIVDKLELTAQDQVLEVGCGTGILLFPLSVIADKVYGIDHPDLIARLKASPYPNNCHLLAGNWLEEDFELPMLTKIVINSVIHHTNSYEQAITFIEKAFQYIPLGGKILVGDIPNTDKKNRFMNSAYGKQFYQRWSQQREAFKTEEEIQRDAFLNQEIRKAETTNHGFDADNQVVYFEFTDEMIADAMKHFRKLGHECYVLPQKYYLPFGHTREDLLLVKGG